MVNNLWRQESSGNNTNETLKYNLQKTVPGLLVKTFFVLRFAFLHLFDDSLESLRVTDGYFGKDFAIQLDVGGAQLMDQSRVGGAMQSSGSIDIGLPLLPFHSFLFTAIKVSVLAGFQDSFLG